MSDAIDEELAAEGLAIVVEREDAIPDVEGVVFAPDLMRRSELAASLLPSLFPARRGEIIEAATEAGLADDLAEALLRLPDDLYETLQEVWVAIGGPVEHPPGAEPLDETEESQGEEPERDEPERDEPEREEPPREPALREPGSEPSHRGHRIEPPPAPARSAVATVVRWPLSLTAVWLDAVGSLCRGAAKVLRR